MTVERRKFKRRRTSDNFIFIQQSFLGRTFKWVESNVLATKMAHPDPTVRRRIIVLAIITCLGSVTLLLFGGVAFYQGVRLLGFVDFLFASAFIVNLYLARVRRNYEFNLQVGIILAMLLYGLIYLKRFVLRLPEENPKPCRC